MSEDRNEKYDAYGHLRKNIEEKTITKRPHLINGLQKIVQVFLVSMLLLSILVFSMHLSLQTHGRKILRLLKNIEEKSYQPVMEVMHR